VEHLICGKEHGAGLRSQVDAERDAGSDDRERTVWHSAADAKGEVRSRQGEAGGAAMADVAKVIVENDRITQYRTTVNIAFAVERG
jgi:hypothetical protein